MELVWEDPPVPEGPFFTKDLYDKYSLAPTVRELWTSLQSPVNTSKIKQKDEAAAAKASCGPSEEGDSELKDKSSVIKDESHLDCDEENASVASSATEEGKSFPEPRMPYPCLSSLSVSQHRTYLNHLMSTKKSILQQALQTRVNAEVMEFTRYLQDVAKICANDYHYISEEAEQYSEDLFRACLEHIKTNPPLYQIHEMTSLTGGTFNPGLKLTFEKQLLIMGNVDITDHKIVPADAQLARDYQSVSSENPPAKKAKDMHATISSDSNAQTLSDRYEPHVCLTQDALVRLLDNHGPDFREQWELPVLVKCKGKGSAQKKSVYVDSPLLKTEISVREKNHVFHEESLKLSIKKNGRINVFHLMTELPASEQQTSAENPKRDLVSFESDLDFDVDLADLETFGESTSTKTSKRQKMQAEQDECVTSKQASSSSHSAKTKRPSEGPGSSSSSHNDADASVINMNDHRAVETTQPVICEVTEPKTVHTRQENVQDLSVAEDSDDENLVIDDTVSPSTTPRKEEKPNTSQVSPISEPGPVNSEPSSPQKGTRKRRQPKRQAGDQLGEILRMQTAMFKTSNDTEKKSTTSQEIKSPSRCTAPQVCSHPPSLVKPCVSTYLERSQNQDRETSTTSQDSAPAVKPSTTEHKKILSEELQAGAEDEQDYEPPDEGNLLYKLYSLQDLLLLVRSSVSLTHTRDVGCSQNKHVPVHVLPKLEYQLCYGVECLSNSEACQLWTETVLHSGTVSYIAHIDVFTSKVALLRKLPDNWKENISCGFKPSKSLNILHHLLKKLTGLDEGRYLITHEAGKPFVTILKATLRKGSQGSYNLQQVHSDVPQPPASGLIPWIPVDPAVVLPFHLKHGHVPCTFPITPTLRFNSQGPGQNNNPNGGGKKRKKKSRAAKRKQYIQNLIQKSV